MPDESNAMAGEGNLPLDRVSIDFLILADFAQVANGKLTVVGAGWTLVNAQEYPTNIPFGIGIGILIPWNETNRKHHFTFSISGEGGLQLASGGGEVEAGRQPGLPVGITQRAVLGIAGQLNLTAPGTYQIEATAAADRRVVTFQAMPAAGQFTIQGPGR